MDFSNQDDPGALQSLTDSGAHLRRSKSGRVLIVDFSEATDITDAHLASLIGLTKLREVCAAGWPITDAVGQVLRQLANLQSLDLQRTEVTDTILDDLQHCSALKLLDLTGTRVTLEKVRGARKKMIATRIVHLDAR